MSVTPEAALRGFLDGRFPGNAALGVAVSGGGDSVALLHLTAAWCRGRGLALQAATVDHGLREAAAAEAAGVAQACAALGVAHRVLDWRWDGQGNLQDAARQARRGLLAGWAEAAGLEAVLLGHTADDQAETVLMRLARGSGVDGLCGMAAADGLFLRPLLEVSRAALRDWLRGRGIGWVEDPSNDDARFDRVKARRLLGELGGLGLTPARLLETAGHMRRARATLWAAAGDWVAGHVRPHAGDLVLGGEALQLDRGDTPGRVLAAAVQWIGGAPYRPRLEALRDFAAGLARGETRTLGGVLGLPEGDGARLTRELAAVAGPVPLAPGVPWDGRWLVAQVGPQAAEPGLTVAALGEAGLAACPDWRRAGLPRASMAGTPAVWRGERLIAAPVTGLSEGWQASLCLPFDRFIVSH